MVSAAESLYEQLGVSADADLLTLRRAYRRRALECHPDRSGGGESLMAEINAAWAVLSDPTRRAAYDESRAGAVARVAPRPNVHPGAQQEGAVRFGRGASRKDAWFAGLRMQAMRLCSEAARSASQALAIRHRRSRAVYDLHVDEIIGSVGADIENRVRSAREAGSAPLDLALAAALVGVRARAVEATRRAGITGVDDSLVVQAELIDRIWDNLAHGVSRELEQALGGNPRVLRRLTGRRV